MSETTIHPRESYTEEVDGVDEQQWNSILQKFDDANLMQTWSYASARWGQGHTEPRSPAKEQRNCGSRPGCDPYHAFPGGKR